MYREESKVQQAIVEYLKLKKILVFSVPNEGLRSIKNRRRMKAEGILSGTSDLIVVVNGRVFFVEIKTKNGNLSNAQKDFKTEIERQDLDYVVWRSIDDAIEWVESGQFQNRTIH